VEQVQWELLCQYRKLEQALFLVTIISGLCILILVLFETAQYLTPIMKPEILVDGGNMEKLPIKFDITFPHLPCYSK
jgi:preprotein translocase subunit SecY